MNHPINDPAFWRARLTDAINNGRPHQAVYHVSVEEWQYINEAHARLLKQILPKIKPVDRNLRILDAGCGYGELRNLLPKNLEYEYIGVDLSQDLLSYGLQRHPNLDLRQGDLRSLEFTDRYFDIAIARSIEGMVTDNLGFHEWKKMENELLRVSARVLLLNYSVPKQYILLDSKDRMNLSNERSIELDGGTLVYRAGMDGTVEVFDIMVPARSRRQGIGARLLNSINCEGTIYGFTRASNTAAHAFYISQGFTLHTIPNFYRGENAVMFLRPFTT